MLRFPFTSQHVSIGPSGLQGYLDFPEDADGLILFVHEQGCGRNARDDNQIAARLRNRGYATLLLDLFGPAEQHDLTFAERESILVARIKEAAGWARSAEALRGIALHCFGSGDVADAVLQAVSECDGAFGRVVIFEPVRDPSPQLLEKCPVPVLVLERVVTGQSDRVAAFPGSPRPHQRNRDREGLFDEAARKAAEWFGSAPAAPAGPEARPAIGGAEEQAPS